MKKYITKFSKNGIVYISDVIIFSTDWECAEIFAQIFFPKLEIHGEYISNIKF